MKTGMQTTLTRFKVWLRKGFGVETFTYYAYQPMTALKADIQRVLDTADGFSFYPKLSGTFLSDHEFEMTMARSIVFVLTKPDQQERQAAYVYGKLAADEQSRTTVYLAVRPNALMSPALALLLPFIWLAVTLLLHVFDKAPFGVALCLALAGFPLLLLHIVNTAYAKRRLREKVVSTFNLQPDVR